MKTSESYLFRALSWETARANKKWMYITCAGDCAHFIGKSHRLLLNIDISRLYSKIPNQYCCFQSNSWFPFQKIIPAPFIYNIEVERRGGSMDQWLWINWAFSFEHRSFSSIIIQLPGLINGKLKWGRRRAQCWINNKDFRWYENPKSNI